MTATTVPAGINDPLNQRLLAVSEDRLEGFQPDPVGEIAARSGLPAGIVVERLRAMLEAGTIRRIRQTLLSTNLADGALVAWKVPPNRLDAAFDFMFQCDPFSGHVVLRSTDAATAGASFRLWTTLKVPEGFAIEKHAAYIAGRVDAEVFRLMPAKCLFALGVGHVRRRGLEPGSRSPGSATVTPVARVSLSDIEWRVLRALKREFAPDEIGLNIWRARANAAGLPLAQFCDIARGLAAKRLIGRFSTFLEHVKAHSDGERVTRYNALFHWAVPEGRELEAGQEIGSHHIVTHAYWRETGPEFGNVNIIAVVHGTEMSDVLAHKGAMDAHLASLGINVGYTNVFWGGRSEIKPSEVDPDAYVRWCRDVGIDADVMRAD